MKPIYLDYNATTPIDDEVVNEMLPYLKNWFGNPSSSYSIGQRTKDAVELARQQVAGLINAEPHEIVFTSGGTESNNHAIRGIAFAKQRNGKHIITSAIEHPAVVEVCKFLTTLGWAITSLAVDEFGAVNPKDVENAIRKDTSLITIMHANNEVGTVQPITEIAEIAKQHKIAFHTDAAQSAGKIKADVQNLGVDLLTLAGHKLYAPKGIGALYIKEGTKLRQLLYGAGQENGFRPGTENVPYIVALGKACEIAQRDFEKNSANMLLTRNMLLDGLKSKLADKIHVNGAENNCLPNTLSLAFSRIEAHQLASVIDKQVLISTGSACHEDSIEISPVLKAMKVDSIVATGTVRISTGKHTTEDEINQAIEIITNAVKQLSQ